MLGVHNGCALEALDALVWLEVQLGLVAPPGAVGKGHHRLAAELQALDTWLHAHVLDEVPLRVVPQRRGVSTGRGGHMSIEICFIPSILDRE